MRALGYLPLVLVLACACEKRVPPPVAPPPTPPAAQAPPPPPPEPIRVPRGCALNLGGTFHHAKDPRFTYAVEDDGERVHVTASKLGEQAADPTTLEFARTPHGFVGVMRQKVVTRAGESCTVEFDAEIVACGPDSITVRNEETADVERGCRKVPLGGERVENVLVKEK